MKKQKKITIKKSGIHDEGLAAVFLLGFVLFNYPILSLFDSTKLFFGFPLLYGYIFFIWLVIILLIGFFMKKGKAELFGNGIKKDLGDA